MRIKKRKKIKSAFFVLFKTVKVWVLNKAVEESGVNVNAKETSDRFSIKFSSFDQYYSNYNKELDTGYNWTGRQIVHNTLHNRYLTSMKYG